MADPTITRINTLTAEELSSLSVACQSAKELAYCPYSNFRVGCALLCEDGQIVQGANIENASYPVGVCAERAALCKAIIEGKKKFRAVAVATDIEPPASPCGMCRQFIREFCDLDVPIIMHDKNGKSLTMTLEQLLPMSFGPEALTK